MTGLKNGVPWEASPYARYGIGDSSYLGINLTTYSDWGSLRENLNFGAIMYSEANLQAFILGDAQIAYDEGKAYAYYFMLEQDGDVLAESYDVDTTAQNYIELTEIDTANHRIKGRFSVCYLRNSDRDTYPERVCFTDGEFDVLIE